MGFAWARGYTKLRYAPKEINIEPTNICNYRCSFCQQSNPAHHELPSGFMKLEDLDVILDKVIESGAAWNGVISYTHDGEPLLHPDFVEFVGRANRRGLRPRFSSNASELTPGKADQLEATGYFRPSIDFSGSKEVFETHRGKRGHWERVRNHIAYLIEMSNRNPKVSVEINEMSAVARPEDTQEVLQRLRSVLPAPTSRRVMFRTRVFHNFPGIMPISTNRPRKEKYRKCPYPWVSMVIAWNGEVHACGRDLTGLTRLGNILSRSSLWDIWNGEKFQEFRHLIATQQPEKFNACRGCDLPWSGAPELWKLESVLWALRYR